MYDFGREGFPFRGMKDDNSGSVRLLQLTFPQGFPRRSSIRATTLIMIRDRFYLAVFQPYMYTLSQTLNGCSKGNG
jgi:hypothetical protein